MELNIGIIGTDTSHAIAFTRLLNARVQQPLYAGRVITAYPWGSPDFPLSISRVEKYMEQLESEFGIIRAASPQEVAERSDALLLTTADGRNHLELFQRIMDYGKPVYIDKPLALTSEAANEIFRLARQRSLPVMSASALRYAEGLMKLTTEVDRADIRSAAASGLFVEEPTQSIYYWYGIHVVEMLYAILGAGCEEVKVTSSEEGDVIRGQWSDGRIGTAHLLRAPSTPYYASVVTDSEVKDVEIVASERLYVHMMTQIMDMFHTGRLPIDWTETVEVIRFMEAAEESRRTMKAVRL